jgi:hypothetical protein
MKNACRVSAQGETPAGLYDVARSRLKTLRNGLAKQIGLRT